MDDLTERCVKLASTTGLSMAQIGKIVGLTKNAVIGRIYRHRKAHDLHIQKQKYDDLIKFDGPSPKFCQWIDGEPTETDACKCLQPVARKSSYCPAHTRRVWKIYQRRR